jgi:hypothetical protein
VWSDVDLVVTLASGALDELLCDVSGGLDLAGRRLFTLDKPRNSRAGGA